MEVIVDPHEIFENNLSLYSERNFYRKAYVLLMNYKDPLIKYLI